MKRFASVIATISLAFLGLEAQVTPSHAAKTFNFSSAAAGTCQLRNGVLTIQSSGQASWTAQVASGGAGGSNNSYCVTFSFNDRNGTQVFKWPRICSPTLYPVYRPWSRDGLAVPEYLYDTIKTVSRSGSC